MTEKERLLKTLQIFNEVPDDFEGDLNIGEDLAAKINSVILEMADDDQHEQIYSDEAPSEGWEEDTRTSLESDRLG